MLKRGFDVLASTIGLVLLTPLMAITAILVRLNMGSPVLFRQPRPGMNGRLFKLCKFRTMRNARDDAGNPLPDKERITPLGHFLRKTSLDELPEFLNVIRGDMSLVGPRPLLPEYLPLYSQRQFRRHELRPGITGWAQVNGRNSLTWEERLALDVWYVENQSFWLDLRILWMTVGKVLTRDGISHAGEATMKKFEGTGHHT